MRLIVSDASAIFDMAACDLLGDMFRLPDLEFYVPDTLYVEELSVHHGLLPGLGLNVSSQPSEVVECVAQLRQRYHAPSVNDLFALALARALGCALLSDCGPLRSAAASEGIELLGTAWLVEVLLQTNLVSFKRATAARLAMRRGESRLPG